LAAAVLLSAVLLSAALSGCAPAPPHRDSSAPLGSVPQTFRYATAKDLRLWMVAWKRGPDGFPVAIVQLRNITEEDVIVAYEPGSVQIHCGNFVQKGPPDTAILRREILGPLGWINFAPPSGGWVEMDESGSPDLSVPTRLPGGRYPLSATFQLGTAGSSAIATGVQDYDAP
jgi:hypothetical protein